MNYLKILLLSFFVFSCSKIETGLSLAPRYVGNQIDDAFDFKSEKLTRIKKQIDEDIQASKKELAQKFLAHLQKTEDIFLVKGPNVESLKGLFDDFAETQTFFFAKFKSSAEVTLKDLSEKEVSSFKKYTDKKYDEELELSKDRKAFLKKRKSSFLKTFNFFLDDLTDDQEQMVTEFVDKNLDYFKDRIKTRQSFSENFYLKIKENEPALDLFLTHYSGKKLDAFTDQAQKDYLVRFFEFEVLLWKTVNDSQKKYFKKTLEKYQDELTKISAGT